MGVHGLLHIFKKATKAKQVARHMRSAEKIVKITDKADDVHSITRKVRDARRVASRLCKIRNARTNALEAQNAADDVLGARKTIKTTEKMKEAFENVVKTQNMATGAPRMSGGGKIIARPPAPPRI